MKKRICILIFLMSINGFSQRETDNWYFGYGIGLNFSNPTNVSILTNGNISAMAGCAVISDKNGKLLFYTNGNSIWNDRHLSINSGGMSPFKAGGDIKGTQNSIIVPQPNSENIYYLFTASEDGFYYNIIDTSSGTAKITLEKSKLLDNATSKVSAVHHKDGKSIWVTTIGSQPKADEIKYDTFFTYKIDLTGLIETPIKSPADNIFIQPQIGGALKISPNGKLIAAANYTSGIELYNFNSSTGEINNKKHITVMGPPADFTTPGISPIYTYGLEFSEDSNFLYTSAIYDAGEKFEFLIQYKVDDLSKYLLDKSIISDTKNHYNSLQLSSNGKIYKANTLGNSFGNPSNYLSVINDPTKEGRQSSFQDKTITYSQPKVMHGLPNFIQSYFRTRIITNDICVNSSLDFSADSYAEITKIEWDFGDSTTSSEIKPIHTYSNSGTFTVIAKITVNNREIIKHKLVTVFPLPVLIPNEELIQCDVDNNGSDYFDLTDINSKVTTDLFNNEFLFYKSKSDAENDKKRIENPNSYQNESVRQELFVRVISENGCYNITNFFIESKYIALGAISPVFTCDSSDNINGDLKGYFDFKAKKNEIINLFNLDRTNIIRFYPSLLEAQTTENEFESKFTSTSTTVYVRVDNDLGCGGIEPIEITVNKAPIINLEDNYTICTVPTEHSTIILDGNPFNEKFEWRKNEIIISTDRFFTLTTPGNFSLTVYKTENDLECSNYKEFTVNYPEAAEFREIIVNTETNNNTIFINIDGSSNYQFSLDNNIFFGNDTTYTFNEVSPGLKTIYVRDINNCEPPIQKNVSVIGYDKFFTPNGDGDNDHWNVKGLDNEFFKSIRISIFDRYGKIIHSITTFNTLGWDGTYNGKKLESNSYWFTANIIDLDDNLIKKTGNFSLIRK